MLLNASEPSFIQFNNFHINQAPSFVLFVQPFVNEVEVSVHFEEFPGINIGNFHINCMAYTRFLLV